MISTLLANFNIMKTMHIPETSYKNGDFCSECAEVWLLQKVTRNDEDTLLCHECIGRLKVGGIKLDF